MATVEYGNGYWRTQQGSSVVVCTDDNGIKTAVNMGCDRNSNKTAVNKDGLLYDVLPYEPSVTYINGVGVLNNEKQETNYIAFSEDFTNPIWFASGSRVTVSSNQTISPDGSQNADAIMEVAVTGAGKTLQTNTAVSNGFVDDYMFFKKLNRPWIRFLMSDLTTGDLRVDFNFDTQQTIFNSSGSWTDTNVMIEEYVNGWFRVRLNGNKAAGTEVTCTVQMLDDSGSDNYTGDVTKGVYVWGAETGDNEGSYIRTNGAAYTRLKDEGFTTPDLRKWINSLGGRFSVTAKAHNELESTLRIASVSDGTLNNRIELQFRPDTNIILARLRSSNSTDLPDITFAVNDLSSQHEYALEWSTTQVSLYIDDLETPVETKVFNGGFLVDSLKYIKLSDPVGNADFQVKNIKTTLNS